MTNQRLIQFNELQVGDEVIISRHSQLTYLKIIRLPTKINGTIFKVSLEREHRTSVRFNWTITKFQQDVSKHNDVMYKCLYGRDVFLVKRPSEEN